MGPVLPVLDRKVLTEKQQPCHKMNIKNISRLCRKNVRYAKKVAGVKTGENIVKQADYRV